MNKSRKLQKYCKKIFEKYFSNKVQILDILVIMYSFPISTKPKNNAIFCTNSVMLKIVFENLKKHLKN